jgi:tetratricopeptide (TPR) repeat protein
MRNAIILLLLCLFARNESRADVKFVNFRKIDPEGRLKAHEQFLVDNLVYYDHWSPDWIYDIAKDSLIGELKTCLRLYEPLKTDEFERCLLLGEVAHYLYNLDQKIYYDTAEAFYLKAIKVNDKDCRGYWFLGYAYATSDEIKKGLVAFQLALKLVDDQTGVDFWQEYAFTTEIASMPFHCLYALDQYKHRGGSSLLSKIMDSTVRSKCQNADPDIGYCPTTLWQSQKRGAQVEFLSYPLGMKLDVDSNSDLQISGYANRMTGLSIKPPVLTARNGKQIGYSIALVVKVPEQGERLEDFMVSMMKKLSGVRDKEFPFAKEYPNGISYSYNDNSMYTDRGGARIRFFGIERSVPAHPGLALENDEVPVDINSEPGKLNFFTLGVIRSRFPERIFYFFVLDTCEDIREESWKSFEQLITHQLVLD